MGLPLGTPLDALALAVSHCEPARAPDQGGPSSGQLLLGNFMVGNKLATRDTGEGTFEPKII